MIFHDLGPNAVRNMTQVDLVALDGEPGSPIGQFQFHDHVCGIGAFRGRPPWEHHTAGDELLLVLAGQSDLTVLEGEEQVIRTLSMGHLVIVPQGCWHSNDAPNGVTMLYLTPRDGNEHSWDDPRLALAATS